MATLSPYGKHGDLWRILFVAPDEKRKTIRLGKVPRKAAQSIRVFVERLVSCRQLGQVPDAATAAWLADLGDDLYGKLVAVGLADPREIAGAVPTLRQWCDTYIASRTDVAPRTRARLEYAAVLLCQHLQPGRTLDNVTVGAAEGYARWLAGEMKMAANTVRRQVGWARQFFAAAVKHELIARSPFAGLAGNTRPNRERDHFVSREDVAKLLDACPDVQWRSIIALSRFGGLRCPSEVLALEWGHILWDQDRMTVPNIKTARVTGQEFRVCPLFPELRGILEEAWEAAAEGTVHVVSRYAGADANLRPQLQRIAQRAGITLWSKIFMNMRASRATELAEEYPGHVAASWLGHTEVIANAIYRQVTEEHFQRAARHTMVAQSTSAVVRQGPT